MANLSLIKAMVTGNKHATTHYFICLRIAMYTGFVHYIFKTRLPQDIPGKYSPGLDISFLQEYLHISALERSSFPKRSSKSQPARTGTGKLLWQDKSIFICFEKFAQLVIIRSTLINIIFKLANLD